MTTYCVVNAMSANILHFRVSWLPLCFLLMCIRRELKARDDKEIGYAGAEEPLVLLPLEVMVKPLELRFRYHFDGDRPTNRPDKV